MNKILKAQKILEQRLPEGYCRPIKVYSTIYNTYRALATYYGDNYKARTSWVKGHWKKMDRKKTSYINSKYYNPKTIEHREEVFSPTAFSGDVIWIVRDNTQYHTVRELGYLLLHEYGHQVLGTLNEHKCDEFAIRWIHKFIKEGLI